MAINDLISPWSGDGLRHSPKGIVVDPFDFTHCAISGDNRWNVAGEPTLYLASSRAVALAEFSRHLNDARSAGVRAGIKKRNVFRYSLSFIATLDLRSGAILHELGIGTSSALLAQDRGNARSLATFARQLTLAQALLVPAMAFLNTPTEHWNIVVFLEKLEPDPKVYILDADPDGEFSA